MDWFRWHHGSVTDPKFQLVARKSGSSLPDVLAVWAYILETASQSVERGDFGEVDCEALDCLFGFPSTETRTADILSAMEARGLTSGTRVASWDKRQPKREREDNTNAARQATHRAKSHQVTPDATKQSHVTPDNAKDDQKKPRGEERREDTSPSLRSGEVAPQRGTRLPADWALPDEWRAWCAAERADLNPEAVAAKFADYWHSKPGKAGTKLDWLATWRNWVREEKPLNRGTGPPAESFRERDARITADRVRQFAPGVAARSHPTPITIEAEIANVPAIESR